MGALHLVPLRPDAVAIVALGLLAGAPPAVAELPELRALAGELLSAGLVTAADFPRPAAVRLFREAIAACNARAPGVWHEESGDPCPMLCPMLWGAEAIAVAAMRLYAQIDAGERRAGGVPRDAVAAVAATASELATLLRKILSRTSSRVVLRGPFIRSSAVPRCAPQQSAEYVAWIHAATVRLHDSMTNARLLAVEGSRE